MVTLLSRDCWSKSHLLQFLVVGLIMIIISHFQDVVVITVPYFGCENVKGDLEWNFFGTNFW